MQSASKAQKERKNIFGQTFVCSCLSHKSDTPLKVTVGIYADGEEVVGWATFN